MDKNYYIEIENKLKKVHSLENYYKSVEALGKFFLFASLVILPMLLIGVLFAPESDLRSFFFFFYITSVTLYFFRYVFTPFYNGISNRGFELNKYALLAGNNFPEIKDELANALQLVKSEKSDVSPDLVNAAFKSVYDKSSNLDFTSVITSDKEKRKFFTGVVAVILLVSLILLAPPFYKAAYQLVNYSTEFTPPPAFTIKVTPGNKSVTRGENLQVVANVEGKKLDRLSYFTKSTEDSRFQEKEVLADSTGRFLVNENAVKLSFSYYFASGNINSDVYEINVINRPILKNLTLKITPPAYSALPVIESDENGNITTLKGSSAEWIVSSTKNLTSAGIDFNNGEDYALSVDETNARGSLKLYNDDKYKIILTDYDTITNVNPIEYSIRILPDEFPFIEIISPNADVKLGADNTLPFLLKIADDFGFSSLKLHYRLSASKFTQPAENYTGINIPLSKNGLERDINYIWDMTPLFLSENDVITYYFEVFDNDVVSGPKSTKSRTFTVRVPSLDELFATAQATQENTSKSLEETLKEAAELNKELEQISNEMKRDEKEITWEEKEKIENAVEKFQQLEKKVDDINKQLSEMRKEMQENNLLSEETMEKYMELQKLMDEISGEDLKKAFENMQEMLKNMDRDQNQSAFEDMKQNEEFFQKSIERTINLLKRLQIEQKVDELTKRTEDLLEQQEQISQETKENNSEQKNQELAQKQKEVTEKLDKLREEMENLNEKMAEFKDMPKDQLEKMMEEFDKMQNQQLSEMAEQQMSQNQPQQAQQSQQQISENMQQMQQMMQSMQQSMQQQNQMQVFKDMMRAIDNLLTTSKEQEKLKDLSKNMSPSSPQFNENAQQQSKLQNDLSKILEQLNELSQKTFAISPEMGKSLGDAQREMSMALNSLQNRNGSMASRNQGQAMKSLNEAATLMSNAMQNMMQQQGQGSGMMSMMQQLQQMSQQQQMLNQMTQQLQQQGQLSQQQMASLQRLAKEQQLLQKSLQELNKEAKESGQSKKITSDLEKIVREMQEVISGMNTQKLDDELLLKQDKILSKLLDAQRSINERDFEKQRESDSGKEFVRDTPPDVLFSTEEGRDKLRDALLKASREGYSKDYEDLIRKYFEALQKEKEEKGN